MLLKFTLRKTVATFRKFKKRMEKSICWLKIMHVLDRYCFGPLFGVGWLFVAPEELILLLLLKNYGKIRLRCSLGTF